MRESIRSHERQVRHADRERKPCQFVADAVSEHHPQPVLPDVDAEQHHQIRGGPAMQDGACRRQTQLTAYELRLSVRQARVQELVDGHHRDISRRFGHGLRRGSRVAYARRWCRGKETCATLHRPSKAPPGTGALHHVTRGRRRSYHSAASLQTVAVPGLSKVKSLSWNSWRISSSRSARSSRRRSSRPSPSSRSPSASVPTRPSSLFSTRCCSGRCPCRTPGSS